MRSCIARPAASLSANEQQSAPRREIRAPLRARAHIGHSGWALCKGRRVLCALAHSAYANANS
eukprot:scaffold13628_cov31-Tisochrysis_lutea.AAC.4